MIEASISHSVQFHDTDAMGIVWHGNYYKYFEIVRCHLKRKLGIDVQDLVALGYAMPVVTSSAKYFNPLKYGDEITLYASVKDLSYPSLEINYRVTSRDNKILFAEGATKQFYMSIETRTACFSVPATIEAILRKAQ